MAGPEVRRARAGEVVDLIGRIDALPQHHRRALIETLDREGERYDVHRLTGARKRMWLLSQLRPASAIYNVSYAFTIAGELDVDALERALGTVVARHEALRSVFLAVDGEPRQVVLPPRSQASPLTVTDLTALDGPAPAGRVDEIVADEGRRPFDLARGPLLRAALLRTGDAGSVLVLTMHHIVCDGWSMRILHDDLAAAYAAYRDGSEPCLPDLPRDVEVARRQDEAIDAAARERLLGFWREALAGAPRTIDLLCDRPRPAVPTDDGDQLSFSLAPELAAGVAALAQRFGATPFAVLLAAWQALLHRYSRQRDILVGCPVAGRHRLETEQVIGLFVNTVVLRAIVAEAMTFGQLLRQARDVSFAALAHQELPFDVLVDELADRRELDAQPLFQVMVAGEDGDAERLVLPGVDVRVAENHTATAKFDLTFVIVAAGERVDARIEYRTQLFDRTTIERLAGHLRTLVAAAVADPDRAISDLPLLTGDERATLSLSEAGPSAVHDDRPVHALVEDVADAAPDAIALVCAQQTLTYGELDERANRIAVLLLEAGVDAETAVGVCAGRSPDLVAGFLAVLKAGGVYVPLDAQLPDERLRYIADDADLALVLCDAASAPRMRQSGRAVVVLDAGSPAHGAAARPRIEIGPQRAAYLIYTSGSTGRPKGVVCTHGGLRNLAEAQRELVAVRSDDRVLQFHSPGFDVCVSEIVTALCAGARLVLVAPSGLQPGSDLEHTLRAHRITVADLPPVALGAMDPAGLPDLRSLTVGGEACPVDVARSWSRGRELLNAYGPTEGTVTVTAARFDGGDMLPIGRPLTGVRAYVLDDRLAPVPVGVAGELYVGGAGVARGYLGDPALTAQRFVPDPFAARPGQRMYRSGDVVRRLADGSLEFLGRADSQVKVRGYRIELGEIEAVLRGCAGVRRCAVIVREDRPGAVRLVAYVVGEDLGVDSLRRELHGQLPRYMVPEAFVFVADLPTTSSGKLDRGALPAPSEDRPTLHISYAAPRGELEQQIASVWQDVLGLAQVGAQDNFFDLGGNSMLIAKLRARLRERLDVDIPVLELFRHPTVALLARSLSPPAGDGAARPSRERDVAQGRRALAERGRRMRAPRTDAAPPR